MFKNQKKFLKRASDSWKMFSIELNGLVHSRRGVTVKEIAATIGILVLVGLIFGLAKAQVGTWFTWFFGKLTTFIDNTFV